MGFFLETLIGGLMTGMLYSLVALGFVLIHCLHFTLATKQPAMTAARTDLGKKKPEAPAAKPSSACEYKAGTKIVHAKYLSDLHLLQPAVQPRTPYEHASALTAKILVSPQRRNRIGHSSDRLREHVGGSLRVRSLQNRVCHQDRPVCSHGHGLADGLGGFLRPHADDDHLAAVSLL